MPIDPAKAALLLESLGEAEAAILDTALAEAFPYGWVPNPGPQTEAYHCQADIILYGGAAGGGKSDLLFGAALQKHRNSVVFRQAYADLEGPRGLTGRFKTILGDTNGWRGDILAWTSKNGDGRTVEFGALDKPDAEKSYQGQPHDFIGIDEAAQCSEAKVRYVSGWLRAADGYEGRCQLMLACNPPQGSDGLWLLTWFAPWLDPAWDGPGGPAKAGELRWAVWSPVDVLTWLPPGWEYKPLVWENAETYREATPEEAEDVDNEDVVRAKSYVFIPARLKDNPYLRGSGYLAQLQGLPEPLRTQLMKGDFLAGREDDAQQVIPTAAIEAAIERGRGKNPNTRPMTCLGVDVAQGGRDSTTLAPLHDLMFAPIHEVRGVDTKDGPAVAALVVQHRRGKALVVVDCTGGWGGDAATQLEQQGIRVVRFVASAGTNERTRPAQELAFGNMRACMWWRFREDLLDPMVGICLPDDPALKAELTAPRWRLKGTTLFVEEKDELKKRIGRSTNRADAVLQAWAKRGDGALMLRDGGAWVNTGKPGDPFDFHNGSGFAQRDPWAGTPGTPWANQRSQGEQSPFDLL